MNDKDAAVTINSSLDATGTLLLKVGDIALRLTAPACRELSDNISLCNRQPKVAILHGDGGTPQELHPEAVYVNREATLYRGPLDSDYKQAGNTFVLADVNGDGHDDLLIWSGKEGAYGGASFDVYLFDGAIGKYEYSQDFSDLTIGYNGLFTIEGGRIKVAATDGCCMHVFDTYIVEANKPKLVERVTEDSEGRDGPVKVKTEKLIDGKMKEV